MKKFNFNWRYQKKIKNAFIFEKFNEKLIDLKKNSSWKIFFPISICFLSFTYKKKNFLEKISGAAIINRFPLTVMIPICTKNISKRHTNKSYIIENLKDLENVSLNLISQNNVNSFKFLDKFKSKITLIDKIFNKKLIARNASISFNWKAKDLKKAKIVKLNSHSLILIDIDKIFLNNHLKHFDIKWKSLPYFQKKINFKFIIKKTQSYFKNFTDNYKYIVNFKSSNFKKIKSESEFTEVNLRKFKSAEIKKLTSDQAKWPIFFPSSVGIIGSLDDNKNSNFMPCGSTTVVNRHPFQFAVAVSHLNNNLRYRKRYSLKNILKRKKITLGVPYSSSGILRMINYMGNVSKMNFNEKINNVKFEMSKCNYGPIFNELPITYGCELYKKIKLKTHTLLIFTVKKVFYTKIFNNKKLFWNGLFNLSKKIRKKN